MKKALVFSVFFATILGGRAMAADLRNFNPGNIIDDAVFSNSNSMTVEQIQKFLESKVTCDNYGRKTSELGGGTRAQWLAARGLKTPIRCITDYVENPTTRENNYGRDGEIVGGISAAQIIYNYSQQFSINPQAIIATLQKENGMITDEWPTLKQFQEAMGFGCPDNVAPGAPACDPTYKSFSSQIYQAARHFRGYMDARAGWFVTFNTGWNNVGFHPNVSCGNSRIYIENRATVALYTYTPYQPNRAALNAGYGVGDLCSSYGNRNFYSYFTDWFGSVRSAQIVRTLENGNLFLISDSKKYLISSMDLYNQFKVISNDIGFVSQSYLDGFVDGGNLGKFVRNPNNGAIYMIDGGKKYHINSCELVADFGSECPKAQDLTEPQINKFSDGGILTNLVASGGNKYFISRKTKSEILDDESLKLSGKNGKFVNLSNIATEGMALARPIIRTDALIQDRSNGALYYASSDGSLNYVNGAIFEILKKAGYSTLPLSSDSLKMLDIGGNFGNIISNESGDSFIISKNNKMKIDFTGKTTKVSNNLSSSINTIDYGRAVIFEKSPRVYMLKNGELFAIDDWNSVLHLNPSGKLFEIPSNLKNVFKENEKRFISTNQLIKSRNSPAIYMIDGELSGKKYVGSFEVADSIGVNGRILTLDDKVLAEYPNSGTIRSLVNCSGDLYIGSKGELKYVGGSVFNNYAISGDRFESYSPEACQKLTKKGSLTNFVISKNGGIYKIENGEKRHIRSMAKFADLGGKINELTYLDNSVLNIIKNGVAY